MTKSNLKLGTGPMMTGVSYMIPVICLGGILQSIGTMIGGPSIGGDISSFAGMLYAGGSIAMSFVVPVLAAYIAYGICDRPGIAPGLVIGMLSVNYKIGFVGGIIGGYAVGYFCKFIKDKFSLSKDLQSLMPLLIIPILGGIFAVVFMGYLVGPLIGGLQTILIGLFSQMAEGPRVLFGLVFGAMVGVDFGGPVTKIATTVANGLVADGVIGPEGAKVVCCMVPPLSLGLASLIFPKKFSKTERANGPSALVLGCCQVTEGGLPYLLRDPLHVWPAVIPGTAIAAAIAMYFNVGSPVMMGGFFAFPVMTNVLPGAILGVLFGVVISTGLLGIIRKDIKESDDQIEPDDSASASFKDFDITIKEG